MLSRLIYGFRSQCRLLKQQPHDIRSGREKADDWGLFRECLGGFAACGLLRKTTPNYPTVVGLWMHRVLA